jgi:hypothetical protein
LTFALELPLKHHIGINEVVAIFEKNLSVLFLDFYFLNPNDCKLSSVKVFEDVNKFIRLYKVWG